jgi:hypothetical protein
VDLAMRALAAGDQVIVADFGGVSPSESFCATLIGTIAAQAHPGNANATVPATCIRFRNIDAQTRAYLQAAYAKYRFVID